MTWDWAGQRVWIIGASSGIGAELARELDRRGARVAISARRLDALRKVAQERMAVVPMDASDPDAVAAAAHRVRYALGGLDVLVFSDGNWTQMLVRQFDAAVIRRHLEVNVGGLANAVQAVLPGFLDQRQGRIVGIASVAGYRGLPAAAPYGSSTAAMINLLESLRVDLHGTGVAVQTVCPGFVKTPMTDINDFAMPWLVEVTRAARSIADGVARDKAEIVFPLPMALAMKAARLVPVRVWPLLWQRARARKPDRPRARPPLELRQPTSSS